MEVDQRTPVFKSATISGIKEINKITKQNRMVVSADWNRVRRLKSHVGQHRRVMETGGAILESPCDVMEELGLVSAFDVINGVDHFGHFTHYYPPFGLHPAKEGLTLDEICISQDLVPFLKNAFLVYTGCMRASGDHLCVGADFFFPTKFDICPAEYQLAAQFNRSCIAPIIEPIMAKFRTVHHILPELTKETMEKAKTQQEEFRSRQNKTPTPDFIFDVFLQTIRHVDYDIVAQHAVMYGTPVEKVIKQLVMFCLYYAIQDATEVYMDDGHKLYKFNVDKFGLEVLNFL